jgi:iron-sulfur cluster assembly protein
VLKFKLILMVMSSEKPEKAFIPVRISPRAIEEVRHIMEKKGIPPDYGLRLGVRGSGCGVSFIIGFDKARPTDLTYRMEDIPVLVDKKHVLFLTGKIVDFYEGEEGRGFTFLSDSDRLVQD